MEVKHIGEAMFNMFEKFMLDYRLDDVDIECLLLFIVKCVTRNSY